LKKHYITILLLFILSGASSAQVTDPEAKKLYEEAITAYENENYENALTLYEKALKIEPGNQVILYEIGYTYLGLKNYPEVINRIAPIIERGEAKIPELYMLLGSAYDDYGDPYKATAVFKEGIEKFPSSGRLYFHYGYTLYRLDKNEEAINILEQGMKAEPDYAGIYYVASLIYAESDEEIWALIYAEIFLNLAYQSGMSEEVSKLIYDIYESEIKTSENVYTVSFSKSAGADKNGSLNFGGAYETITLGLLPAVFGKYGRNFEGYINYRSGLQNVWIKAYDKGTISETNIIFERAREIMNVKEEYLECYNYLLLFGGNAAEAKKWLTENEALFTEFVEWFDEHPLKFNPGVKYYRAQYQ
jgi:tetratricopeptide (TPR) repeat protein